MNRIIIISNYPPSKARLSEYTYHLIKELNKFCGDDIEVILLASKAGLSGVEYNGSIKIYRVWDVDNPLSILSLIKWVLKLRAKLIHVNMHFQSFGRSRISNFIAFLLIPIFKLLGMKVIVTIHNLGELIDLKVLKVGSSIINRIGLKVATLMMLTANKVVVLVKLYREYLRRRYKTNKIEYIPHGPLFDVSNLDPGDGDMFTGGDKKVILMFGHMSPYKGLDIIIEAFKRLYKVRKDIQLVVAGSDHPNYPGYIDSVMDHHPGIHYLGYVDEDSLPNLFNSSDIVVLPYKLATGTSGVFHLACAFGKPIVASDLIEIRELVNDGASALLFRTGDIDDLISKINYILDNTKLRMEMSRRNRLYALRNNMENVAKRYVNLYKTLLGV